MGGVPSTPRGDARPEEHGDYLLGVLVGENAIEVHSRLWERLLNLPLTLHWPDDVVTDACKSIVHNSKSTGHLAKLLLHLGWSLKELYDSGSDPQPKFARTTNAVRFSSVFLKYAIEHLGNDELRSCLSLSLNDEEAEFSGLRKGNQNVANFVVFMMLSFVANSDINSYTYLLHLEVVNLLLVMMSTQVHQATLPRIKGSDMFLDAAMSQEPGLVSLVAQRLLLSFIARPSLPHDAPQYFNISKPNQPGMLERVGLAAAIVLRLPYYTYNYLLSSKSSTGTSPLASSSVLLLLVLAHHHSWPNFEDDFGERLKLCVEDESTKLEPSHSQNLYYQALKMARDTEYARYGDSKHKLRISFTSLYDALGLCLKDEYTALLLYTLMYANSAFLEYALVRTDLDTLLMPLLEMLYNSLGNSIKRIYMLVIILLILTQDSSFNSSVHKSVLPAVPWFKDQILNQITLGSLMVVILTRTVKYNLSTVKDVYLHTNCLAALANMAPYAHKLNAYASQRLLSLFELFSRKYFKLCPTTDLSHSEAEPTQELQTIKDLETEVQIYTDFLRLVFEIINAIITYALPYNPEVVYALLHRQELFKPFQDHPLFNDLAKNVNIVLSYFNSQLDARKDEIEWHVETVLQTIVTSTRSWRAEGIKMFPQLRFTYEEQQCPEDFFIPYVWQLVVSHSGISWDRDSISLFAAEDSLEPGGEESNGSRTFEVVSTPRVQL
ncbi:hypothetical protein KP509_32G034600 [Ceratopteris richardii]|uniref:Dymeclin n=1 Tax=Ceratopteris richardii TaxID=49495 RepID=A0A8T2QSZ5_CERRI|nr:hypothetical protein KP509_32G034600 [Ceratopteris richardii]